MAGGLHPFTMPPAAELLIQELMAQAQESDDSYFDSDDLPYSGNPDDMHPDHGYPFLG